MLMKMLRGLSSKLWSIFTRRTSQSFSTAPSHLQDVLWQTALPGDVGDRYLGWWHHLRSVATSLMPRVDVGLLGP